MRKVTRASTAPTLPSGGSGFFYNEMNKELLTLHIVCALLSSLSHFLTCVHVHARAHNTHSLKQQPRNVLLCFGVFSMYPGYIDDIFSQSTRDNLEINESLSLWAHLTVSGPV